jgi:cytochrome c
MFKKPFLFFACLAFAIPAFSQAAAIPADIASLLEKNGCVTCHKLDKRMIGPSWIDIAAKKHPKKHLVELVYEPAPQNWPGYVPMQPMPQVPKSDLNKISAWIVGLGGK